jgi:hypothetical protein
MLDPMMLDSRLLNEGETPMLDSLRGLGRFKVPVEWFIRCIDRRNANDEGWLEPSSLLSEGRLPLGEEVAVLLVGFFGSADGQRVVRDPS